jgi:hypothetical protein
MAVRDSDVMFCDSLLKDSGRHSACFEDGESGTHPEFFLGMGGGGVGSGRADPEAIYNLCSILKIIL